jgi:dienelactone hydrolase
MAEVLLFHHAQGLTPGVHAFADALRGAGHVVHTPDLYDGATFADLDEAVAHARSLGFDTVVRRGVQSAEGLPRDLVYAGISLGTMPAQTLLQTRPGAHGALLLHGAVDPADLGGSWPPGVPGQVHTMAEDDWGDVDVGRQLAASVDEVELFLYPGSAHLFTDSSLAAYDADAAQLVQQRVLAFLDGLG